MRGKIAGTCLAGLLLSGCASYTPTAAPAEQATDSDLVFNADGYGAKIDPYIDEQRQKQYFNADFTKAGFLVVDVVVKNEGKDPIDVKPYDIYLVFPGGNQMAPLAGQVVATQIDENGSIVGSVLMFGVVGGLVATSAEQNAKNARIQDYTAKQLKETTLAPGASTQGYLFYRWTPSASAQAEFAVRVQDHTNNHLSEVIVPLGTTKPFAVPQSALFVPSAPPANPPAASGTTQTASTGSQATAGAANGPVDVPFKIDFGAGVAEGIAQLENGQLLGQASNGGKPITLKGTLKDRQLSIEVYGAIGSRARASYGDAQYCSATATLDNAQGSVTIPLPASCGPTNVLDHIELELPPAS